MTLSATAIILALLAPPVAPAQVAGSASSQPVGRAGTRHVAEPATEPVTETMPQWRLAIADVSDVSVGQGDLGDAQAATVRALVQHAESASDRLAEFDRRLMAANWILAHQLEPMASRLLLEIARDTDAQRASELLIVATAQLDRAGRLWNEVLRDADFPQLENRKRRKDDLRVLRAFAAALSAVWQGDTADPQGRDQVLRRAASGLTPVLENVRSDVSTAALLWQGFLFAQRSRLDRSNTARLAGPPGSRQGSTTTEASLGDSVRTRALDLLPLTLSEPAGQDAYAFYARLLRCRCLVEALGDRTVSVALLIRLEVDCHDWYDDHTRSRQARRAAALVRRQIMSDWQNDFHEAGRQDRADWCQRTIDRIDADRFSSKQPADLLRLGLAIPEVVNLTDIANLTCSTDPTSTVGLTNTVGLAKPTVAASRPASR